MIYWMLKFNEMSDGFRGRVKSIFYRKSGWEMEWMESHLQDPGSQFFIWAFCPSVMSRQKRLFPTITKSNSKSQSKQNCYEPRKTVISDNYKIRGARCKNLRLQSIGWLNNLYNFFETRIRCDWISLKQCILSLDSLHHSSHKDKKVK